MESIPQENSWADIQKDWDKAMDALHEESGPNISEVIGITTTANDIEGIANGEKYLKDNFDKLTRVEKNFLLTSLRVKNFRLNHPNN